jgi:hypothetical protein
MQRTEKGTSLDSLQMIGYGMDWLNLNRVMVLNYYL